MANGVMPREFENPLVSSTPAVSRTKRRKPLVLVTIKTDIATRTKVSISVAVMMLASIALGIGIIGTLKPNPVDEGSSYRAVVPGYPFSGADRGIYAPDQLLVKFSPGVDIQRVTADALTDPQVVLVHGETGQTLQSDTSESLNVTESPEKLSAYVSQEVQLTLNSIEDIFPGSIEGLSTLSGESVQNVGLRRWKRIVLNEDTADLGALAQAFRDTGSVEYAEPNRTMRIAMAPNDEFIASSGTWGQPYTDLWGLRTTKTVNGWDAVYATRGDLDYDGMHSEADIDLLSSYIFENADAPDPEFIADVTNDGQANIQDVLTLMDNVRNGLQPTSFASQEVIVAIIDTGADYSHADLNANIWVNTRETPDNGLDDDGNGFVDDVRGYDFTTCEFFAYRCQQTKSRDADPSDKHGHGTHVAGIVGAVAHNGIGISGVCSHCRIMPLKGLNDQGTGYIDDLAAAIEYAANNGADVINASWGGTLQSAVLKDAFHYAWSRGVVSVAAAGNSNADVAVFSPANIDTVISVAAVGPDDRRVSFSNYGAASQFSSGVDIAAPGGDNNGKSWIRDEDSLASHGGFHTSSLTGAQARIEYLTEQFPQTYSLEVAVGPDKGVANVSYFEKNRWYSLGTLDTYATQPDFATVDLALPVSSLAGGQGWVKVSVSGAKNDASSGYQIGIDGGRFQDEDIDDQSYLYLDSDADLTIPMSILSLRADGTDLMRNGCCFVGSDYIRAGGTSMSAAYVSGLAGLLRTKFPNANAAEISGRLSSSADALDDSNPDFAGLLGSGRMNVERALEGSSSPALKMIEIVPRTPIRRGQATTVDISIINKGTLARGVNAQISSSSGYVTIQDASSALGDLNWSDHATSIQDPFTLTVAANAPTELDSIPVFLRLNAEGYTNEVSIDFPLSLALQQWSSQLEGLSSRLAPIVDDMTGDARKEIVVESAGMDGIMRGEGKVAVLDSTGASLPGWPVDPDPEKKQTITSIAVGDITGDGNKEIVVVDLWTSDGYLPRGVELYAFDLTGNVVNNFPIVVEGASTRYPRIALANLDDSPGDEIAIVMDGIANVYDGDGSVAPGWPRTFSGDPSQPAIGDLDGDGSSEIVFFTESQGFAFTSSGFFLPGWPVTSPGRHCDAPAVIADLKRDGTREALITSCQYGNSGLFMYDHTGVATSIPTLEYSRYMGQTPVPVDLDGNGDLEIIVPTLGYGGTVDAWHHDGARVEGWPAKQYGAAERGTTSPVVGDLDGDGKQEILFGTWTGFQAIINGWNHDGQTISGFPLATPFTASYMRNGALALTDLDADGLTDVVAIRSSDPGQDPATTVTLYEFPGPYRGASNPWPAFQHDGGRTGQYQMQACSDGTLYAACNAQQQYCDNGKLLYNCAKCSFSCPQGYTCQSNGVCASPCKKIGGRIVCLSPS